MEDRWLENHMTIQYVNSLMTLAKAFHLKVTHADDDTYTFQMSGEYIE